ncbi:hypothetical protein C8R45DRAFT_1068775 [Mycena sanguinolenta]|nr:hypothetical protein C8R45DRAFT_1068775 [Mycena sanguinolenta]
MEWNHSPDPRIADRTGNFCVTRSSGPNWRCSAASSSLLLLSNRIVDVGGGRRAGAWHEEGNPQTRRLSAPPGPTATAKVMTGESRLVTRKIIPTQRTLEELGHDIYLKFSPTFMYYRDVHSAPRLTLLATLPALLTTLPILLAAVVAPLTALAAASVVFLDVLPAFLKPQTMELNTTTTTASFNGGAATHKRRPLGSNAQGGSHRALGFLGLVAAAFVAAPAALPAVAATLPTLFVPAFASPASFAIPEPMSPTAFDDIS